MKKTWEISLKRPEFSKSKNFLQDSRFVYFQSGYIGLWAQLVKNRLQCRRPGFDPWVGKIPWRKERLPTPVFWSENSMDCIVCGVAKSQTWLTDFHFTSLDIRLRYLVYVPVVSFTHEIHMQALHVRKVTREPHVRFYLETVRLNVLYIFQMIKSPNPFAISPKTSGSLHGLFNNPKLVCAKSLQSCPTLCDPVDYSPRGSSVHGILQARIREWGHHGLLQGIFLSQGLSPHLLCLLH